VLTFTWSWQGDVKKNVHYLDRTIDYEGGSDAVQEVAVKPMITFQLSFNSTKAKLDEIEKFYLLHRKSRAFYFTYEDETYTCRFTSDYNSTDTWGYDNTGKIFPARAGMIPLTTFDINSVNNIPRASGDDPAMDKIILDAC
jgi:phage-related protein